MLKLDLLINHIVNLLYKNIHIVYLFFIITENCIVCGYEHCSEWAFTSEGEGSLAPLLVTPR